MKAVIIEDNACTVSDIVTIFKKRWSNCELFTTNKGREGLALASSTNPDLVIIDLEILDMNAFDTIRMVRKISDVPIVVLSRFKNSGALFPEVICAGADRFINKPFRTLEFLARIVALLRRANDEKNYQDESEMEEICFGAISAEEAMYATRDESCPARALISNKRLEDGLGRQLVSTGRLYRGKPGCREKRLSRRLN
jgi:DNA-binding response OmpR family regulator